MHAALSSARLAWRAGLEYRCSHASSPCLLKLERSLLCCSWNLAGLTVLNTTLLRPSRADVGWPADQGGGRVVLWRHLLGDLQVGPGPGPTCFCFPESAVVRTGASATQHCMPHAGPQLSASSLLAAASPCLPSQRRARLCGPAHAQHRLPGHVWQAQAHAAPWRAQGLCGGWPGGCREGQEAHTSWPRTRAAA